MQVIWSTSTESLGPKIEVVLVSVALSSAPTFNLSAVVNLLSLPAPLKVRTLDYVFIYIQGSLRNALCLLMPAVDLSSTSRS